MFLQVLMVIVGYDIQFYISHILLHTYLYNMSSNCYQIVNPVSTYAVESLGVFLPYLFMEFDLYAFIISIVLINMSGIIRHRNNWLIGNHHLLHHKHQMYNYGEYWIDWLCGTKYMRYEEYERGLVMKK
jgi:sterol desaturase/sphingolipid hydroxylase (fatty acid hydroxylase superfamily)